MFFFFQAEDGIRDGRVTGVQTCALPISDTRSWAAATISGTPVGTQVAVPPWSTSGCPRVVTRTVPVVQVAAVHGPPALGGSGQPATVHGGGRATAFCPDRLTRGAGALGWAWPQ